MVTHRTAQTAANDCTFKQWHTKFVYVTQLKSMEENPQMTMDIGYERTKWPLEWNKYVECLAKSFLCKAAISFDLSGFASRSNSMNLRHLCIARGNACTCQFGIFIKYAWIFALSCLLKLSAPAMNRIARKWSIVFSKWAHFVFFLLRNMKIAGVLLKLSNLIQTHLS